MLKKSLVTAAITLVIGSAIALGQIVNVSGASGIALQGYDPVAFFTVQKPVYGNPGISARHDGATYLFSSEKNRDLFEENPESYTPQYGGFCAYGVAVNALFPVDIETWQVRNGKLYLNLNPEILKAFDKDFSGNIHNAQANWPSLVAASGKANKDKDGKKLVNVSGASGIALQGYDPVAFFTVRKPVYGNPGISARHHDATYLFSNEKNRDLFKKNPETYAPQYGGFCAYGVAVNALFPVDIDTWQVRNDKLYLNLNPEILKAFNKDFPGNIHDAQANWPSLQAAHAEAAGVSSNK